MSLVEHVNGFPTEKTRGARNEESESYVDAEAKEAVSSPILCGRGKCHESSHSKKCCPFSICSPLNCTIYDAHKHYVKSHAEQDCVRLSFFY